MQSTCSMYVWCSYQDFQLCQVIFFYITPISQITSRGYKRLQNMTPSRVKTFHLDDRTLLLKNCKKPQVEQQRRVFFPSKEQTCTGCPVCWTGHHQITVSALRITYMKHMYPRGHSTSCRCCQKSGTFTTRPVPERGQTTSSPWKRTDYKQEANLKYHSHKREETRDSNLTWTSGMRNHQSLKTETTQDGRLSTCVHLSFKDAVRHLRDLFVSWAFRHRVQTIQSYIDVTDPSIDTLLHLFSLLV